MLVHLRKILQVGQPQWSDFMDLLIFLREMRTTTLHHLNFHGRVDQGGSAEGYIGIFLCNRSDTSIKIQWGFSVRNADVKEVMHHRPLTNEFGARGSETSNAWYKNNFARRSKIMDALVDGSLVIEVRLKNTATEKSTTQFIPTNPFNKNVSELFNSFNEEETADV